SVFKMTVDVYSISPFPTSSLCIALFAFAAVDQLQVCMLCGQVAGGAAQHLGVTSKQLASKQMCVGVGRGVSRVK
ncbi:MAG: hypothetical protein ACT6T3_21955, partial [Agrobacterium sp.]|uniref:hypothetical protein n=1 Tax=Agrobacterium sp. TaxID=361 RepID=UPI0040340AED